MTTPSPELLDIAGRPDTVIFVGSGVSAWSGLPSWRQLIERLIDRLENIQKSSHLVRRELENNDLLQAASYGMDKLTQQQRGEFLREICSTGQAEPSDIHAILMSWGNSCYITTNYDKLLEDSIRQHRPGETFEVVTPAQDWEVASLQQARASRFVFKPHGDIGDAARIVVTREDYSILRNQRTNVFSAYRMLLTSRPVIYVGFGLRDPDFLLLKESIATDFGGSPQDHYAIMPDVTEEEVEYWRRNYGIHIISYETLSNTQNSADRHKPLLDLLANVGSRLKDVRNHPAPSNTSMTSPANETLALARHARRLRTQYAQGSSGDIKEILPISLVVDTNTNVPSSVRKLARSAAPSALTDFTGKCIVDGAPGAGKTFALRSALRARAETLEDLCLDPQADFASVQIPIYAALSRYNGDISDMLDNDLPGDLSFKELREAGRLAIFLDAFNEIPSQYLESGRASEDIGDLVDAAGENTVVITTRFGNDLASLGLPSVHLDAISRSYVMESLSSDSTSTGSLSDAVIAVFQRPLFFQQYRAGVIVPAQITNVHDVYSQLMGHYSLKASRELGVELSLDKALSFVGYQMVDAGDLTLGIADLHAQLRRALPGGFAPSDLVSWLLKQELLIALPNKRVIFSHHSFPEYFAAYRLSVMFSSDSTAPEACFGKKRWDQAVLLTMGFLPFVQAQTLLKRIFEVDAQVGMRSLNYVETNRADWANYALDIIYFRQEVHDSSSWDVSLDFEFAQLALDASALPSLWKLAEQGGSLGGVAAAKIWILGDASDRSILRKHISQRDDYNYLNRFAEHVVDVISEKEALDFLAEAGAIESPQLLATDGDECDGDDDDAHIAAISAVATLLSGMSVETILSAVSAYGRPSPLLEQIILHHCYDDTSSSALAYTIDAVIRGVKGAEFALHLQLMSAELRPDQVPLILNEDFAARLLSIAHKSKWAVKTIQQVVAIHPGWSIYISNNSNNEDRAVEVLWLNLAGDRSAFMNGLAELHDSGWAWSSEARFLLAALDIEWAGYESLLARIFFDTDTQLLLAVSQTLGIRSVLDTSPLVRQAVPQIRAFIDSLCADSANALVRSQDVLWLTAHLVDDAAIDELRDIVVTGPVPQRRLVAHGVLSRLPGFTVDELPAEAIDWMVSDLGESTPRWYLPNLLNTATEALVSEKLLPLLLDDITPAARLALLDVLKEAGERHARRYVDESGSLLL